MEGRQRVVLPECGYYLNTIYFYLTEGCNLRCRHCWITPKYQTDKKKWPSLDFELFKYAINQGVGLGLSGVKLTGGEPLIHPDIIKILNYTRNEKLQLTVETNAVECTPIVAKNIAQCKKPFVDVSLDGIDPVTHEWVRGVSGCFEAAINGIRNLVHAGVRPQIIMSVMRHNADQLEAVVRLAEKEKALSVKFNLVTPTVARGEQMYKAGELLSIQELIKLGAWVENSLIPSTKIRVLYSHPIAFRPLNILYTKSNGSCAIFNIIGVLGSGKYALCGIGEVFPELVFGLAATDKLASVWNENKVLQDIRKGLPNNLKGICKSCLMKGHCLGSCIAANYYQHRDLFAAHWYCEEAHKVGLFPASRMYVNTVLRHETTVV